MDLSGIDCDDIAGLILDSTDDAARALRARDPDASAALVVGMTGKPRSVAGPSPPSPAAPNGPLDPVNAVAGHASWPFASAVLRR